MFSELLLDHFRNPRNAGKLANPSAAVQTTNPVCGDILELSIRVENGEIAEARFLCRGCTTSIACSSFLTERLTGNTLAAAAPTGQVCIVGATDSIEKANAAKPGWLKVKRIL